VEASIIARFENSLESKEYGMERPDDKDDCLDRICMGNEKVKSIWKLYKGAVGFDS
jgi:hypothetical protein